MYEGLANAIILQAVKDYRNTVSKGKKKVIEKFFNSDWFAILSEADPKGIIDGLRKEDE